MAFRLYQQGLAVVFCDIKRSVKVRHGLPIASLQVIDASYDEEYVVFIRAGLEKFKPQFQRLGVLFSLYQLAQLLFSLFCIRVGASKQSKSFMPVRCPGICKLNHALCYREHPLYCKTRPVCRFRRHFYFKASAL